MKRSSINTLLPSPLEEAETFAEHWRASRSAPLGRRFRKLRRLRKERERKVWRDVLYIVAGIILLGLAIVFTFLPGPNWLFFIPGATLLAYESRAFAYALDQMEIAIHPLLKRTAAWWKPLPRIGKALVLLAALGLAFGTLVLFLL